MRGISKRSSATLRSTCEGFRSEAVQLSGTPPPLFLTFHIKQPSPSPCAQRWGYADAVSVMPRELFSKNLSLSLSLSLSPCSQLTHTN